MENKKPENINTETSSPEKITPTSSSSDIEPLKIVENGVNQPTPTDADKKEEKRKKKQKSDNVPLRNHQSHMPKNNGANNEKVKREKCNYTEQ